MMGATTRVYLAAIATLALLGATAGARAQTRQQPAAPTVDSLAAHASPSGPGQPVPDSTHRSLQWDDKGRWGLKLDLSEPVGRDVQLRDVQAGAYYRVTPSLRVGGAVALGDAQPGSDRAALPQSQAPRVRLETTFKF